MMRIFPKQHFWNILLFQTISVKVTEKCSRYLALKETWWRTWGKHILLTFQNKLLQMADLCNFGKWEKMNLNDNPQFR